MLGKIAEVIVDPPNVCPPSPEDDCVPSPEEVNEAAITAVQWVLDLTLADIYRWQSEDESIDCMLRHKETRTHRPPFAKLRDQDYMRKCLWQHWDRLTIMYGIQLPVS